MAGRRVPLLTEDVRPSPLFHRIEGHSRLLPAPSSACRRARSSSPRSPFPVDTCSPGSGHSEQWALKFKFKLPRGFKGLTPARESHDGSVCNTRSLSITLRLPTPPPPPRKQPAAHVPAMHAVPMLLACVIGTPRRWRAPDPGGSVCLTVTFAVERPPLMHACYQVAMRASYPCPVPL